MATVPDLAFPGGLPTGRNNLIAKVDPSLEADTTTSEVPTWAYDVTQHGAVGDGIEGWYKCTWTSPSTILSAYTFLGNVTIAVGSAELVIDVEPGDGIVFEPGRDEGASIAIQGAGLAGGVLLTTIVSVSAYNTCILADTASTALAASSQQVIWPAFTSTSVNSILWMDAAQVRLYYNPGALYDTTDTFKRKAFMSRIAAVGSPFEVTLTSNLPQAATAALRYLTIGSDNSTSIAAAANAMRKLGQKVLWFPGRGLYCGHTMLSGTVDDPSFGFTLVDTTIGETNLLGAAHFDALWHTANARGFFTDSSGRQLPYRIVPVTASSPPTPRSYIHGNATLSATAIATAPIITKAGDSSGTDNPSRQNLAQTPGVLFDTAMQAGMPTRDVTIRNRAMGGATWAEMACSTNTRGVNIDTRYTWWTNTAISWLAQILTDTPVPECFDLVHTALNDQTSYHPLHQQSVITRLRALTTTDGKAPDIILHSHTTYYLSLGVPSYQRIAEMSEYAAGVYRGMTKYGYGFIDLLSHGTAMEYGWDPTRRALRRAPSIAQTLAPTTPLALPKRSRAMSGRLTLKGVDGLTVWTAVEALRIQLSDRADNYIEISTDGSGFLTTYAQLWGMSVPTTASITNGAATLVTSGQTAHTEALAWGLHRTDVTIGTAGAGPLTSGDDGMCLLMPQCDYGSQPQRTQIEKILSNSSARVVDNAPARGTAYSATATAYIGGIMFVEHDAYAQTDIIITDSLGNMLQTKIIGFTDRNTVTLQDVWPHATLLNDAATIWIGQITEPLTTTTIDAEGDAGADPYIDFAVYNNHVRLVYALGSTIDTVLNLPVTAESLFNKNTIRGGGPFVPVITCTGAGLSVTLNNLWLDADVLFKTTLTRRELRGSPDGGSLYGGEANHESGKFGEAVVQPTLSAANFALTL